MPRRLRRSKQLQFVTEHVSILSTAARRRRIATSHVARCFRVQVRCRYCRDDDDDYYY